MANSNIYCSSN